MSAFRQFRLAAAFADAVSATPSAWRPDASPARAPAPVANDDQPVQASPPKRVLIVEDEVVIAMTLESFLEDMGFETCGVAGTGAEAVALARAVRPDLVLMDVTLIGAMDGVEAARLIHDTVGSRIVFVTAYGSGEVMKRIRIAVPDAQVVAKPATATALRRAIEATEGS